MAVSAYFQAEIDEVDNTKTLVFTTDAVNYAENEWSYNGLEITGHDDIALEHGASALLYAMGFRHYGPTDKFIKRPVSIPTNLTAAKQSYWMPYNRVFLAYGHDSRGGATYTTLMANYRRWQDLNNVYHDRLPAGHRWAGVISNNQAYFNANPDMVVGGVATSSGGRFNLNCDEATYNTLVHFVAAYLLDQGLNSDNRTNFDPTDGDSYDTDTIIRFTKAVVDKMRAGTDAIGGIDAQAAVPTAQLGIYAYAGHRLPPVTQTDLTGIYVQIALAFNSTSLTYLELIQQWGALADFVGIREYFDVMVWYLGIPQRNFRNIRTYYRAYEAYQANNVLGANGEFQANWLMNMAAMYTGIRVMKTGNSDPATLHDAVLGEMVDDIFDGDPAVLELLTRWSRSTVPPNKYTIKAWFDLVNDMVDSWYKTDFEQYMVIIYEWFYLPAQSDTTNFPTAFSSLMSKIHAITADDFFHSYAMERRLANGAVAGNYPALAMYANPLPDWYTNPVEPTHQEFVDALADLTATATRLSELESDDLVLMKVTPISGTSINNPNGRIRVKDTSTFCFVGPGTFTFTTLAGVATSVDFGPGKHILAQTFTGAGYAQASNGGKVFVYTFPIYDFETHDGATLGNIDLWMYVPEAVEGSVDIEVVSRFTCFRPTKLDVLPDVTAEDLATIPAGQVQIQYNSGGTRSTVTLGNVNPWLSPYPDYALIAREIAESDFPARVAINVPAFAGSDDRSDPIVDETPEEIDG